MFNTPQQWKILVLLILGALVFGMTSEGAASAPSERKALPAETGPEAGLADYRTREGYDFATRILRDPWDMSQFTDVSQWLNHSGVLLDLQVQGGVFSATTEGDFAEFFPLFPGYSPGLLTGKIGARYPIDSSQYSCFYMAMYANWSSSETNYFHVFWAPSRAMPEWVDPSKVWGMAYGNTLNKGAWQLYRIDLNQPVALENDPWSASAEWQVLRIIPSLRAGTDFGVDWVRLTDCQPVHVRLTSLPAGTYSFWLKTGDPQREILISEGFSPSGSGIYDLDVQGIQPGSYDYSITDTNGGDEVRSGILIIEAAPIFRFNRPSPYSGPDFATSNGNPWDFDDDSDVHSVKCAEHAIEGGLLSLNTSPPHEAPASCVGAGADEMDPIVFLNMPVEATSIQNYRYLSVRHRIEGALSRPEAGMVARWIWKVDVDGTLCEYVSREIPLEIGWGIYTVDLFDDWNGMPVEAGLPQCSLTAWKNQTRDVVRFRVDPNENITSADLYQEFDWIRLTQVDRVTKGQTYPVKILLNKPVDGLQSIDFYYTTSLSEPAQNRAEVAFAEVGGIQSTLALHRMYLPMAVSRPADSFVSGLSADLIYEWDTHNVSPGEYYICAEADDGYNQSVFCSEAPVLVLSP